MNRSIEHVFEPTQPHMVGDGFRVHNFFPSGYRIGYKRMSPFFLMDYNSPFRVEPSQTPRGVGVHPHRGFETVTIAYKGKVAHHDSAGNSGVIGEGDVQWMTAGSGVLHKEYHEQEFSRSGGWFQMVQLWVNLPARHKMTKPRYQGITRSQMTAVDLPGGGTVEVIAGEFQGHKGPAKTFSPMHVYNVRLPKGGHAGLSFPAGFNTGMVVIEGSVRLQNDKSVKADRFVLFANDGEDISLQAEEDAVVLVLSGEPIDEPIASYGPFLMNTQEELVQAVNDFNEGKFGELEE